MKEYPLSKAVLPNGETIAYRKAGGTGKTLLLIHGNMTSSVHWQTTMEALEDSFTLYAPDLRGFGDSSYLKPFDSLGELARDMEAFADAVGLNRFTVLGWSAGGGLAMEMAADWPERIAKLVLLDSVPPTGYPMYKKDENGRPIFEQLITTKAEIAADPVQVLPALNAVAAGDRDTMRMIWDLTIYHLNQPPDRDYERYLDAIMQQRNLVDIDYSLLMFNMTSALTLSAPGSGRLKKITCPVTLLHGEKDKVVPLAWGQETLAAFGERAKMITFPNAGHSPITDEPKAFFAALRAEL